MLLVTADVTVNSQYKDCLNFRERPANFNNVKETWPNLRWVNFFPRANVTLTAVPKTGYTTAKAMASIASHRTGFPCVKKLSCHTENSTHVIRHMGKDLTRIVVLRDPFERILSTWMNIDTNKYLQEIGPCNNTKLCDFPTWMDYVDTHFHDITRVQKNEHFNTQVKDTNFYHMHYDYVGNTTHLDCLWPLLNYDNDHRESMHFNPSKDVNLEDKMLYFTPEIVKIVEKRWGEDIKLWQHFKSEERTLVDLVYSHR